MIADKVKADTIETWKAEIIEKEHIKEVLDKIRAEIWDLMYGDEEKSMTDEDRADAYNNAVRQVIDIIDKYSEDGE